MDLKFKYLVFKVDFLLFLKLLPISLTYGLYYFLGTISFFTPLLIFQETYHTLFPFLNYFLGKIIFLVILGFIWFFLIKIFKILDSKYWNKYFYYERKLEIMKDDIFLYDNVKYLKDGTPYITRLTKHSTASKLFNYQILILWFVLTIQLMEILQRIEL